MGSFYMQFSRFILLWLIFDITVLYKPRAKKERPVDKLQAPWSVLKGTKLGSNIKNFRNFARESFLRTPLSSATMAFNAAKNWKLVEIKIAYHHHLDYFL